MANIVAKFTILDNVENPKNSGIKTGYAPHHRFNGVDYLASGFHEYENSEIHYPGETIIAYITFPSWEFFKNKINIGDVFLITELDRVIGKGKITSIIS